MHKQLLHELASELETLKSTNHQEYQKIEGALLKVVAYSRAKTQASGQLTPELQKAIAATDKSLIEKRAELQQAAQQRQPQQQQRQQIMQPQRPPIQAQRPPMQPQAQRPTMQQSRPNMPPMPSIYRQRPTQNAVPQPTGQPNQQTGKRTFGYKRAYSNNIQDWI